MEEIAAAQLSLLNDRGTKKVRITLIRGNRISGYIRPISPFKERRQPPGGIPSI